MCTSESHRNSDPYTIYNSHPYTVNLHSTFVTYYVYHLLYRLVGYVISDTATISRQESSSQALRKGENYPFVCGSVWLVTRMIRSLKRFVQKKKFRFVHSRTQYWGDHFSHQEGSLILRYLQIHHFTPISK